MTVCTIPNCGLKTKARGLCNKHYANARHHGRLGQHQRGRVQPTATLEERLRHHGWTEVLHDSTSVDTPCWEWNGYRDRHGYGQLQSGGGVVKYANRVAAEVWIGPIPEGHSVCHRCDNPPCINPDHLFYGPQAANVADMLFKRRESNGERNPQHKITDLEVQELRARYAAGGITQKQLARDYGISKAQVGRIIRRERRPRMTNPQIRIAG